MVLSLLRVVLKYIFFPIYWLLVHCFVSEKWLLNKKEGDEYEEHLQSSRYRYIASDLQFSRSGSGGGGYYRQGYNYNFNGGGVTRDEYSRVTRSKSAMMGGEGAYSAMYSTSTPTTSGYYQNHNKVFANASKISSSSANNCHPSSSSAYFTNIKTSTARFGSGVLAVWNSINIFAFIKRKTSSIFSSSSSASANSMTNDMASASSTASVSANKYNSNGVSRQLFTGPNGPFYRFNSNSSNNNSSNSNNKTSYSTSGSNSSNSSSSTIKIYSRKSMDSLSSVFSEIGVYLYKFAKFTRNFVRFLFSRIILPFILFLLLLYFLYLLYLVGGSFLTFFGFDKLFSSSSSTLTPVKNVKIDIGHEQTTFKDINVLEKPEIVIQKELPPPAPVIIEKIVEIEKPVIIEIEKIVEVEKPIIIEKIVEKEKEFDYDAFKSQHWRSLKDELKAEIKHEIVNQIKISCPENCPPSSPPQAPVAGVVGGSDLSDDDIEKMIKKAIRKYDADKTGIPDLALETAGGSILSTRCTKTWPKRNSVISVWGIKLWSPPNNPRTIIQPGVVPGECWAFEGSIGDVVIQLIAPSFLTGFTMEHIPKELSPYEQIDSAPYKFQVIGLNSEQDLDTMWDFGNYTYEDDNEPIQYFRVQNPAPTPYPIIELKILSNHGHPEYTCLYRFRVHGTLDMVIHNKHKEYSE